MVTRFCYIFKCLPTEALNIQAVQFFTLLDRGEKIRDQERDTFLLDLLSIESIGIANHDYYQETFERFKARIYKPRLPEEPKRKAVDAGSTAAQNMFLEIFGGPARG